MKYFVPYNFTYGMPSLTKPCRLNYFAAQLADTVAARVERHVDAFYTGGDQLKAAPSQLLHPNGSTGHVGYSSFILK